MKNSFQPFLKTPKYKTISCFDKTIGCFSLSLKNTFLFKRLKMSMLWIQSRVDYINNLPHILSKTAQQQQAQPSLQHPSKGLDSSNLEHHLVQQSPPIWWRQIPGVCVWFDWIWSSTCKNSIYTIQCFLQQQVRFLYIQSIKLDKQSVVYSKQSVVFISNSRNHIYIRDFNIFKQFQIRIHKTN